MTSEELSARLSTAPVIVISGDEWDRVAPDIPVLERHDTGLRGDLLIVRTPAGLAAVESPSPRERVLRRFADEAAASRFVADRLASYERMWNGCGCRIDYYR